MEKKRPAAHEGIIVYLRERFVISDQIRKIICLYAIEDIICPAKAIPEVIAALEYRMTISPSLENMINDAIANLRMQLAEHMAKEASSSEKKTKDEALIKEEENFQNPSLDKPWSRTGKFTVELRTLNNQKRADVIMRYTKETDGFIASHEALVVTAARERKDELQWQDIEAIRDGKDNLLWKRRRHQKSMKLPPPRKLEETDLSKRLGLNRSSEHP